MCAENMTNTQAYLNFFLFSSKDLSINMYMYTHAAYTYSYSYSEQNFTKASPKQHGKIRTCDMCVRRFSNIVLMYNMITSIVVLLNR